MQLTSSMCPILLSLVRLKSKVLTAKRRFSPASTLILAFEPSRLKKVKKGKSHVVKWLLLFK